MSNATKQALLDQIVSSLHGFRIEHGNYATKVVDGVTSCVWSFCVNPTDYRVEFCDKHVERRAYSSLLSRQQDIEFVFGGPLRFETSAPTRSRVALESDVAGWQTGHPLLFPRLCTDMKRLQTALAPFLPKAV